MINFKKQTGFILILVAIVIIAIFISTGEIGTYGVNKTVGWAYNIDTIVSIASFILILAFYLIGYVILLIFNIKLHKLLTYLNVFLLCYVAINLSLDIYSPFSFYSTLVALPLSFILFLINIILSIVKSIRIKNTTLN